MNDADTGSILYYNPAARNLYQVTLGKDGNANVASALDNHEIYYTLLLVVARNAQCRVVIRFNQQVVDCLVNASFMGIMAGCALNKQRSTTASIGFQKIQVVEAYSDVANGLEVGTAGQ